MLKESYETVGKQLSTHNDEIRRPATCAFNQPTEPKQSHIDKTVQLVHLVGHSIKLSYPWTKNYLK